MPIVDGGGPDEEDASDGLAAEAGRAAVNRKGLVLPLECRRGRRMAPTTAPTSAVNWKLLRAVHQRHVCVERVRVIVGTQHDSVVLSTNGDFPRGLEKFEELRYPGQVCLFRGDTDHWVESETAWHGLAASRDACRAAARRDPAPHRADARSRRGRYAASSWHGLTRRDVAG